MSKEKGSLKLPNTIFTNGFNAALVAISSISDLPHQFAWDVVCFITEYKQKAATFTKMRSDILEKDCKKDKDGKPEIATADGAGFYTYNSPEEEAAAIKKVADLEACDVTFKINKFKIKLTDFKVMPQPKHLHALDGILDVRK